MHIELEQFRILPNRGEDIEAMQVAWSPDEKLLAVANSDGTVSIWDVEQQRILHLLKSDRKQDVEVRAIIVSWSPDSKTIAAGYSSGHIQLWNRKDWSRKPSPYGHERPIYSLAWSSNSKILAAGSADNSISLWSEKPYLPKDILIGHDDDVYGLAWANDNRTLISASIDQTIRVWDIIGKNPQKDSLIIRFKNPVLTADLSPNRKILAAGFNRDCHVLLYDASGWSQIGSLIGHKEPNMSIYNLSFSKNGQFLASRSRDSIRIWDCDNWRLLNEIPEKSKRGLHNLAFHPTFNLFAAVGLLGVYIWKLDIKYNNQESDESFFQNVANNSSVEGPTYTGHQESKRLVKILFLAANPIDTPPLQLDEEIHAIDQALLKAKFRDRFEIIQHHAVRTAELQSLFLRYQPDILHFSGHGSSHSEIILKDDSGVSHPIPTQALSTLFSVLKDNIRCVVLNACYTEEQAKAISQYIDCVIGMSKAIGDASAIKFASSFYQALGYGRDIKTAFDLGCLEIHMENLSEKDTPKLIARRVDPKNTFLVGK